MVGKGEVLKGASQALGRSVNSQRQVRRGALTTTWLLPTPHA